MKAIFDYIYGIKFFAIFDFVGVFFLLELIFADQVPSAKSRKIKPGKIKVVHSIF